MLQNRIYRGEIVHKDKSYPGEHQAIIDEALWNEAQAILMENRIDRALGLTDQQPSLLSGLLYDAPGERLTPTHAVKKGVRYRYYVSRSLIVGTSKDAGQRIPATNLEALVTHRIRDWLADRAAMLGIIQGQTADVAIQKHLMKQAGSYVATWDELSSDNIRRFIITAVTRIQVHADRIEISLSQRRFVQWLDDPNNQAGPIADSPSDTVGDLVTLAIPARLRRAGMEMKLVVEDGSEPASPDAGLIRLLIRAHVIRDRLVQDKSLTLDEIAKSEGIVPSYATRLFRLALLAPEIVSAILAGKHPPELNARKLLDDTRFPLDWSEQQRVLGFA
jgi:hypothetical protein